MSKIKENSVINESELEIPDFDNIKVSTMTIVIVLNISINTKELFEILPVTNFIVVSKKRGRKKKNDAYDPNKDVPFGSIITLEHGKRMRGVCLKKTESKQAFRNSITVVMLLDNKMINFKLSNTGVIQMTGCKSDKQAEDCVYFIWNHINKYPDLYSFKDAENEQSQVKNLKAIFIPAMRNIDFNLGFLVNREILDEYININTNHLSIFDANFGYTGVNIKIKVDPSEKYLSQVEYATSFNIYSKINYEVYLNMLSCKDRQKKIKKNSERVYSFMVFHSGKTIMSGETVEIMKKYYYSFFDLIKSCKNEIEEKLL